MILNQTWRAGVLIREDDDAARTVTTWDNDGSNMRARPYTADENLRADRDAAGETLTTNENSIRDKLRQALETNNAYLAIATPTAGQTTAQVKALSRMVNGLIRVAYRSFESDS